MVDANSLLALTHCMEQAQTSAPLLGRWVDRAKELQTELAWRVVSLSRYLNELPESSYTAFADALTSALRAEELESKRMDLIELEDSIREFAKRLEEKGQAERASSVRNAVKALTAGK